MRYTNKFTYEEQKKRKLQELLRMLQSGQPQPSGWNSRRHHDVELGNDSGGNPRSPAGQYVPGYPPNDPKHYDGRMRMIKGGRKRKR